MSSSPSPVRLDGPVRLDSPVRVDARLDDHLSRWLWLFKWLLAVPHFIVLALLWLAFAVLSFVALVAIVITGRYPRGIFDFNVGVLRWSWRVAYYSYGALGTDRYPPFSLAERPDYPAHLEIAYPERLSRGLALVKWWLLAIPHYLLVAVFLGAGSASVSGSVSGSDSGDSDMYSSSPASAGLISLLVLVAAIVVLFTGRYPRGIFDLVLGLNRWVLRVAAYATLMTDQYPPFRLDQGGAEPDSAVLATGPTGQAGQPGQLGQPGPGPGRAATAPRSTEPWGAGRIIAVIVSSVLVLTSLVLLAGGLVLRLADGTLRDNEGYLMSSSVDFESPGHAITSQNIDLGDDSTRVDLPQRWLGTVRIEADARTADDVFIGVARTSDVATYLYGVAHSTVVDPVGPDGDPVTTFIEGGPPSGAPADETFWVASAQGDRRQTISWEPTQGDWTLVVMNADGTTPVAADVAVGAELPVLDDIAIGLLIMGSVLLLLSVGALLLAVRRRAPAGESSQPARDQLP